MSAERFEFCLDSCVRVLRQIAYIIFSCCLSYTILVPQNRYQVGNVELYVILYLVTLGVDIVREFLSIDAYNWSQKVSELKTKVWTMCDLTFIILDRKSVV